MGKKNKLRLLQDRRLELIQNQNLIIHEIVSNSVDPTRTHQLIIDLTALSWESREMVRAIDAEIERRRKNWWERLIA